jgi:DNA primase
MGREQAVAAIRKDRQVVSDTNEVAPPVDVEENTAEPLNLNDPITRFERQTLEVLVQLPHTFSTDQLLKICSAGMSAPAHNRILKAIQASSAEQNSGTWLNTIASNTDPSLHQILREAAAQPLPAADSDGLVRYGQGVIARAITNALARGKADLLAELRRVEPGSPESAEVQRKLMALESERRALQ